MKKPLLWALVALLGLSLSAFGQYRDMGLEIGFGGGVALINNESDGAEWGLAVQEWVGYPLLDPLQLELGFGFRDLRGADFRADLVPIELCLRACPFHTEKWIPYIVAGAGMLNHDTRETPPDADPDADNEGWVAHVPVGAGIQYRISKDFSFDLRGQYSYVLSEEVNPVDDGTNDSYLSVLLGIRATGEPRNPDPDGDGLTNAEEKLLGTDRRNPDTDGDGLNDGEEYKTYHTNPLLADTDGDGLSDAEEVRDFLTDPLKPDTDGDGLTDAQEVQQYKTDPKNGDTDGDGLGDAAEIMEHKTDPLKADTDGDTLSDGAEINQYRTNPLKADTDDGTVNDNVEVARGSNPLNPGDDVPKIAITEIGKPIILEGIVFKSGSAKILPESEKILDDAYVTLRDNASVVVEIQGHTDNTGKYESNVKLSLDRANAVRDWLIAKGIDGTRLETKGFGPDKPVAPNTTPEDRQKNRRIEFVRIR